MRIWNPYGMADQENGVEVYGSTGMIQIGRWKKQWGYKLFDEKGKLWSKITPKMKPMPIRRTCATSSTA